MTRGLTATNLRCEFNRLSRKRTARASGSRLAGDPIGSVARLPGYENRSDTAPRPAHQIIDGASLVWAASGMAVCREGFANRHAC